MHERNVITDDKTGNSHMNQNTTPKSSLKSSLSYSLQFDVCPEKEFYLHFISFMQNTELQNKWLNFVKDFFFGLLPLGKL
jgi:hypothetical protein